MTPFLKLVADDLLAKTSGQLSDLVLIFPNKRASLFMNEYLSADQPRWAPEYKTISELFSSLSPLLLADPIETVCRVFNIYRACAKTDETLDHFYGWGERLLADFDDVDKNMADAGSLFANLADYHRLTNVLDSPLTEQQRDALKRFLVDFREDERSGIRAEFYTLWDHIGEIYRRLHDELLSSGQAYEGMLYRKVVEGLKEGTLRLEEADKTYVFVGFNVLDRVEHEFFTYLHREGRARFYWDYDEAYVSDASQHEAGRFLRDNLRDFPNELPPSYYRNFYEPKRIDFLSAPTENAQVFAAADWLGDRLREGADPRRTALVLCNEDLIEPVLHALPDEVRHVNITKGFPIAHTPAAELLERQLREATVMRKSADDNAAMLEALAEKLHAAAVKVEDDFSEVSTDDPEYASRALLRLLYVEAYYETSTIVERFLRLVRGGLLRVEPLTLSRLLRQMVRKASVPFHGDPAQGLQVLGVLETRNLDFDNILLLSTNEDMLPKRATINSFIPYPLRQAYGLSDSEKRTAVFAYYFYRLLQRASHVRLCYNNTTSGVRTAEMSRFMRQLLLDDRIAPQIRQLSLGVRQKRQTVEPLTAEKPANIRELLNPTVKDEDGHEQVRPLSPTSINNFVDCPLRFFYQRIARLHTPDPDTDEIENTSFGSIFHKAAELLYTELQDAGGNIAAEDLHSLLTTPRKWAHVQQLIDRAFAEEGKERSEVAAVTIEECLRNLIRHDARLQGLRILGLEKTFSLPLPLSEEQGGGTFHVGGIVDRLDSVVDQETGRRIVRVVDYKTGTHEEECKTMEQIFEADDKRPHYFLQTFLYALAVKRDLARIAPDAQGITAALFYPLRASGEAYDPRVKYDGQRLSEFTDEMGREFTEHLSEAVGRLLDTDEPFRAVPSDHNCRWCDFRPLCGRREEKQ